MYREAWRIQREFFYDPNFHGLDLAAAEKKYEPFLERVASRSDLNYLFAEMLGDITVSHLGVGGGVAARGAPRADRPARRRLHRRRTAVTASPGSTTARTGTRTSAPR